jgi:predicted esterase
MNTNSPALDFLHRFIPAPDGTVADAPTVLLLHGTGGDENDLLELGRSLAPDANLLSPRGKISENGMPRFFRRLAEGLFDEKDLVHRTHELADFVTAAAGHYGFQTDKVTAIGYSNGANIAASLLLLRPGTLAQAVLLRAMVPLIPEISPDLTGTRVFLASGLSDPILPIDNARRLADAGAAVLVAEHELSAERIDAEVERLRSHPATLATMASRARTLGDAHRSDALPLLIEDVADGRRPSIGKPRQP